MTTKLLSLKTLLLAFLLTPMLMCAQLINGDFESWTLDVPDGWTTIDTGIILAQESTTINGGALSASFNVTTPTQGDTDFRQSVSVTAGTTYNISFWAYHTEGGMRTRLYVDEYLEYTEPTVTGSWQQLTYTYIAPNTGDIEVGLRFYDLPAFDGEEIVYIDDFVMEEEVIVGPSIVITAPENEATLLTDATEVSVVVQNFMVGDPGMGGVDGYFVHTLDAGTAVPHFTTDPFMLTGLMDGTHTLTAALFDANDMPIAGAESTISFTVAIPMTTQVSDIASLRAGTQGDVYELTGEAILTYQQTFRNQKYIQDGTAGILIDDNDGNITSAYAVNDGITGIIGTLGEFGNMLQFVPVGDPGAPTSSNNEITVPTITLNDLITNFEDHEAEVVKIVDMTFDTPGVTMENGSVYPISDPSASYNLRTTFFNVDYIGNLTSNFTLNVQGIPNSRTDGEYFTPRELNDFLLVGINEINTFNLSLYPNPNNGVFTIQNGESTLNADVILMDITGKVVYQKRQTIVPGQIIEIDTEISNAGLYKLQVRDTESGKTSSHSIVIQ